MFSEKKFNDIYEQKMVDSFDDICGLLDQLKVTSPYLKNRYIDLFFKFIKQDSQDIKNSIFQNTDELNDDLFMVVINKLDKSIRISLNKIEQLVSSENTESYQSKSYNNDLQLQAKLDEMLTKKYQGIKITVNNSPACFNKYCRFLGLCPFSKIRSSKLEQITDNFVDYIFYILNEDDVISSFKLKVKGMKKIISVTPHDCKKFEKLFMIEQQQNSNIYLKIITDILNRSK